jgi:hypothetical protein
MEKKVIYETACYAARVVAQIEREARDPANR